MNGDLESLGDLYSDPNGLAYQKTESRTGPPLECVAEKLRRSLDSARKRRRLPSAPARLRVAQNSPPHSAGSSQPAFPFLRIRCTVCMGGVLLAVSDGVLAWITPLW